MADEQTEGQSGSDTLRGGGPHSILFPCDVLVWNEARRLVSDKNIRVEDLAAAALQDPAIVVELIKTANALYFSVGKSPIVSVKTAIIRLGQEVVLDLLEKMKSRPPMPNPEVGAQLEIQRSRCKRVSIIARMLAETMTRTLGDDCQAAGLLSCVGEMLAVAHLQDQYLQLVQSLPRTSVVYRLAQDFRFDVEKMGITYLRKQGMPELLLFALDRDARPPSQERAIMKPLCQAALELVDGFDTQKWEKFSPGKTLPPKSPTRSLQIPEQQYLKIYERASEYLFSAKLLEEKQKVQRQSASFTSEAGAAGAEAEPGTGSLDDEITAILDTQPAPGPATSQKSPGAQIPGTAPGKSTSVKAINMDLKTAKEQFSLGAPPGQTKTVPRVKPTEAPAIVEPPQLTSPKGAQAVTSISEMFDSAKSAEELLAKLLEMLVTKGGFEKSAIIVVSHDRTKAIVVAARGPNIGNGQTIQITDPLSPLAQCFSKVQSWGSKESEHSPFGSKAFAISPIDADHKTPVALYADRGNSGAITFENRRVFRTVVDILNQKLPQLPGGIPVELAG